MHTLSKLFGASMHTLMYTVRELVSSIGNPQCIGECEASVGTYFALLKNINCSEYWICVLEGLILQVVRIPLFVCARTVSLELNSDAY